MSRLVFLGTAGDPISMGLQARGTGGIVLQHERVQLHLDPGPGALARARQYGVNPRETTAVLVSHAHLAHCGDLNATVSAMTHGGLDKRGVVAGHESTVTEPVLWNYYQQCLERIIPLQPGKRFAIENVEILATATRHSAPGVGFRLLFPTFSLGYLSDTGYSREIAEQYLDSDVLVVNVPVLESAEHHLSVEDAIHLVNLVKPSLAILTHFGTKIADPLYEARRVQLATHIQCIAARDGMVIDPERGI